MKLEVAIQSTKFKNEMHKAGLNVMYTAWWIKTATNFALKEFDLTQEQYNVMRILNGKHPTKMCVKDIASRMIEKNSNVPRIVDRLELKSLIVRSQGEVDGRQTEISLTQKGIDTLLVSTVALNELWDEKFELSNEEAKTLNDLLEKVRIKEI